MVNKSTRAISISRGEVLLEGKSVGGVFSVTPEGVSGATTVPLPYSASANSTTTLQTVWVASQAANPVLKSQFGVVASQRKFALRLVLDPGGQRTIRVAMGQGPPIVGGWFAEELLSGGKVADILLVAGARSSGSTIGTLQVWRADPTRQRPILTATRPAGWQVPAWFPVSSLPPGGYVFSMSSGPQALVTGIFQTRCLGADGVYVAAACVYGNTRGYSPVPGNTLPPGEAALQSPAAAP
jgi:hypothetical protein